VSRRFEIAARARRPVFIFLSGEKLDAKLLQWRKVIFESGGKLIFRRGGENLQIDLCYNYVIVTEKGEVDWKQGKRNSYRIFPGVENHRLSK
jgi:hypothetical protein